MTIPDMRSDAVVAFALGTAITSSVLHGLSFCFRMPWLAMKAIFVGILVYAVLILVERHLGISSHAAWVAVVAGSASYLKTTDRETRAKAYRNLEETARSSVSGQP